MIDLCKAAKAVTQNMVVRKAKLFANEKLYADIKEFKFSEAWLEGFMKRYNFATRRRTHIAQHLLENLLEK